MTGLRNRVVIVALLALAACHKTDESRSATGQVLQGTVSDAMIPLDQLTSEAPLAPPAEQQGKAGAKPVGGKAGQEATPTPAEAPSGIAAPVPETDVPVGADTAD